MDEYNHTPDSPEPSEPVPRTEPVTLPETEPWMSLQPSVTPEQWQVYRSRMSPLEWEEYCQRWRAYYQASQAAPAQAYGQPYMPSPYAKKPSKFKPVMRAIWPFLAYLGAQFAAGIAIGVGVVVAEVFREAAKGGTWDALSDMEAYMAQMMEVTFFVTVALQAVFIPVFLGLYLRDRRRGAEAGGDLTDARFSVSLTALGMAAAAGCFLVVSGLLSLLLGIIPVYFTEQYQDMITDMLTSAPPWLTILSVVILAPIVEELTMRGLVQRRLEAVMPPHGAIITAAALFGVMHMNLIQGVYAFVLGLLLGWTYRKGRNLLIPILAHLMFNGMNYVMDMAGLLFENRPDALSQNLYRHLMEESVPLYSGVSAFAGLLVAALFVFLFERVSRKWAVSGGGGSPL